VIIAMNSGGIAVTNAYLVADESSKQAVIFDAPNDTAAPLLDEAQRRGFDVIGLWLTHGHFDHIADHKVVTERFPGARVLMHALDAPKLRDPGSTMFVLPFTIPPREPDELVQDGQALRIGPLRVQVLHTPGHSPGHVMYHLPDEKALVGGDLIIMGAVGRTDLPDSDPEALNASIRRVMQLPDDTTLLPGHGQPSKLADERRDNEYVIAALRGA
jgi:glyoxylase-like metal-dependent hydrolase (beta-lactamase superfamily II)